MFCLLPLLFATAGSCCPSLPHWVRIWGQPGKSIALGRKMGAARGIYHTGSVYGDDPGNIYLTGSVYRSGQGNLPHWVSIWGRSGKSTALSQYMGTVREICRTASVYGDGPGNLHISLGQYMGTARGIYRTGSAYGDGPEIYRTGSVYGYGQGNLSHRVSIWRPSGEYISLGQYMGAARGIYLTGSVYGGGLGESIARGQYMEVLEESITRASGASGQGHRSRRPSATGSSAIDLKWHRDRVRDGAIAIGV